MATAPACGDEPVQQFEPLRAERTEGDVHTRYVAARPVQARDQANFHRIATARKDDRDGRGRRFRRESGSPTANCNNDRDPLGNQLTRERRQPVVATVGPTKFDRNVLALDIAGFRQAPVERPNLAQRSR